MTRWTPIRIVATAVLLQVAYVAAVIVAALYIPVLTETPGMEDQIGTGPSLRTTLLTASGVMSGVVVGILLSRFPVGYTWNRVGYSAVDAGLYAAVATVVGTFVVLSLAMTFQIVWTWTVTGLFAPLVLGIVSLARLSGYVLIGAVIGFCAGVVCFLIGGVAGHLVRSA